MKAVFAIVIVLFLAVCSSTHAAVPCTGDAEEFSCPSLLGDRNVCCIKGGPNFCDPIKGCIACPNGLSGCPGTRCIDLNTNNGFCGSCFHACAADQLCCGGICYDAQTDNDTCGRCGVACDGGSEICRAGKCVSR